VHALLAGFPAGAPATDAGLAAVAAADELAQGSLEAAERFLRLAERGSAPDGRRGQAQLLLGVVRLLLAWYQGDLPAVPEQARRLQAAGRGRMRCGRVWARSCARWHWQASPTPRSGRVGSIRQSVTWSRRSRWRAGSDGPISSSSAWCTGRRSSSRGGSRGLRSAAGRRSNWPAGTAGPTRRRPGSPTSDAALLWFLLYPVRELLERHARQRTAHAALLAEILDLLAGTSPASPSGRPRPPLEPMSGSEIRVLRYLPTHLSAREIAGELSLSTSTVKTHMRNLYAKLGAHSRAEAVEAGRALRLLAPSARRH
jgi:DNA-binding CsgD family transcriptional regulator